MPPDPQIIATPQILSRPAFAHLRTQSQMLVLTAYLPHTQSITYHTHGCDPLIKPIQRLLEYPLLLGMIIDEIPIQIRSILRTP